MANYSQILHENLHRVTTEQQCSVIKQARKIYLKVTALSQNYPNISKILKILFLSILRNEC